MEVSVNKHEAQTTPSEQNSAPTKSLGVMTQSKRKLITSEQKPASATIAANIEVVVVKPSESTTTSKQP